MTSRARRLRWSGAALAVAVAAVIPAGGRAQAVGGLWHLDQAHVYGAQAAGAYGRGVVVGVIDTGVDAAHPEFGGRVLPGADCSSGTCTAGGAEPGACTDSWHGTHVAGTVASTDYGVAPEATVLPVKVLVGTAGNPCQGTSSATTAAIYWAVDHGAQVLNLSLGEAVPGVFQDSATGDAVTYAAQHGVVVVFAAGNGDPVLGSGLPVADSYGGNALVVAATGPSGRLASYSNSGSSVSIAAPGGDGSPETGGNAVTSTYPGNRVALSQGTSMATPHVAGLAALLLAQAPGRGRDDVVSAIRSTAHPLAGAGAGLIDATAALALRPPAADPVAPPPASQPPQGAPVSTPAQPVALPQLLGCPRSVVAPRGSRPVIACRVSRGGDGLLVALQQRRGNHWVEVARSRVSRGAFRARLPQLTSSQTLRLVLPTSPRSHTAGLTARPR